MIITVFLSKPKHTYSSVPLGDLFLNSVFLYVKFP